MQSDYYVLQKSGTEAKVQLRDGGMIGFLFFSYLFWLLTSILYLHMCVCADSCITKRKHYFCTKRNHYSRTYVYTI